MIEIIKDTIIDSIKIIPFLFIAFLILEYIEHNLTSKSKQKISKTDKFGPLIGSLLGAIPQCGFGVAATNLYAARIISLGTLISIYLSTSDEMLILMISNQTPITTILWIIILKIIIGMICGFIIDFALRKKKTKNKSIHICEEEHCDCDHGIIKSSLKHTINIFIYITIITFILNVGVNYLGEDNISNLLLKDNFFSPFLSSLIGLIPNCAASVIITELYLHNAISFASAMAGLLTGSGISLLMLFKVNEDFKENIKILLILYFIGAISGIILEIIGIII